MAITPSKPIFCATHPRACSTAFERVFMSRRDKLACVHEPFGDAFYYGPERTGERFENDAEGREKSGFAETTYADVLRQIEEAGKDKRAFIKDMAYYIIPPNQQKASIVPSAGNTAEPTNPTVLPLSILRKFQWTFLIRHPRRSIPSYYRCTQPPLDAVTGWTNFNPSEAGYEELRRLFDYLIRERIVDEKDLLVVDADDMLDDPEAVIRAYCAHVGLDFTDNMLNWTDEDTKVAQEKFAKWNGWHDDAIGSTSLKPRDKKHVITRESEEAEWLKKYGEKGLKEIRECVDANVKDYEYLKKFAIQI
ncbi:uncharacterized protein CCOS01_02140 [Colletotrichum costaricense]|uniref:Branched-chain-amino-acid aminotransferase-like protein 2 n=1 Tax=Colletotrichum costaricense TaxID=1209916 RepID=A0AAI9Z7E0_9PEZI|nr:uncharacterized protein CCOS01_02140 [Colletotrichum costaricense]KAK1536820.1 hypothetical protein CCOS01_02140 [Colletotrichum costaricense]